MFYMFFVTTLRVFGAPKWKLGRVTFNFVEYVVQQLFVQYVFFLRIHSVQSVINNATQLSGRGFPYIFYVKLVLSQHYVVLVLQNGSRAV